MLQTLRSLSNGFDFLFEYLDFAQACEGHDLLKIESMINFFLSEARIPAELFKPLLDLSLPFIISQSVSLTTKAKLALTSYISHRQHDLGQEAAREFASVLLV